MEAMHEGTNPMAVAAAMRTPLCVINAADDPVCSVQSVHEHSHFFDSHDRLLVLTQRGSHGTYYEASRSSARARACRGAPAVSPAAPALRRRGCCGLVAPGRRELGSTIWTRCWRCALMSVRTMHRAAPRWLRRRYDRGPGTKPKPDTYTITPRGNPNGDRPELKMHRRLGR